MLTDTIETGSCKFFEARGGKSILKCKICPALTPKDVKGYTLCCAVEVQIRCQLEWLVQQDNWWEVGILIGKSLYSLLRLLSIIMGYRQ